MKKISGLFVAMMLVAVSSIAQQQQPPRMINVTGTAEVELIPDEIFVQIDLREYDKKGSGKIDIETIKNKFLAAAKAMGLTEKEISVQGYSGYNNWWWYNTKKKKDPDMKASISYLVKLKSTGQMDELVKRLDDEATQNFSIQKVSHSKLEEMKKDLKIQAITNAKEKAVYLAAALGEKIGRAYSINEPNEVGNYPGPRLYATAMKMEMQSDASAPPLDVDFKKIKIKFDVNISFELL